MLDYDDSAFFYFSLAILTFVLVPYWYFTIKTLFTSKFTFDDMAVNCETKWFQDLLKEKRLKSKKSNLDKSMMFKLFVGVFLSYIWTLNLIHVNSIEGLQSFDPYAILDLDSFADEK
jgi:translocation protein SEC63